MAVHTIMMECPPLKIGKVNVIVEGRRNGHILGRLKVPQGRLEWMRGNKKESAREIRWGAFDKLFWEKGGHVRRRSGRRQAI